MAGRYTLEDILEAANAIGEALSDQAYAIVGGAACAMLGSERTTIGIDFVVPRGQTLTIKNILKQKLPGDIRIDSRTRHTFFKEKLQLKF